MTSDLSGKAHVWYELVMPIADQNGMILQT